jgi:hypothetical protein
MESKVNTDERAVTIRAKAKTMGLSVSAHGSIVTVWGRFTPGDKDAYVKMESDAYEILGMFRQVTAGSTWGTDSGSVGGAIGLEDGLVRLNKSGCEKRLASKFYN